MKKMERVTKMLFDGEIHAFESTVPHGLEYQKIQDRFWELMEHIKGRLPEEDAGLFEEWDGLRLDSSTIHEYAFFDYGFNLGVRLMAEAFCGMDANQREDDGFPPFFPEPEKKGR